MYDDWDIVGLVFCLFMLGGCVLFWLILWLDRNSPFVNTRRNMDGRKSMATDWRKPQYLPEDWQ
jgi:hypothetical protein